MFAFIYLFFLEEAAHATGGFTEFWNTYLNYPGFQLWKFINLAIFIGIIYYASKEFFGASFLAKREQIRSELIKAEADKQAALVQLTAAETKLAGLSHEKEIVLNRAKAEADAEGKRIQVETDSDAAKIRQQANAEIARTATIAKHDLRRHSAEETIRRAEAIIKEKIGIEQDSILVKTGIESIAGIEGGGAK